jgi:hypothetical protein
LEFVAEWGDAPIVDPGDCLVVKATGVPVFHGMVSECLPNLSSARQSVEVSGWWKRLDELTVVASPTDDRIVFGNASDSDYPLVLNASAVVSWLWANVISVDSGSPLSSSSITAPTYPCKFGTGGFAIYAGDKLTKVLEQLALMDDCIVGVDAAGVFYWKPRATALLSTLAEVRVAEDVTGDWRTGVKAWATEGRFTYDRRGPNTLVVSSRDLNFTPGGRTYNYADALPGSRRLGFYYAPNVRTGQAARRLALGLFRRFDKYALKVEDLAGFSGTRRFEPHLGKVSVYESTVLVAGDLCGSISLDWGAMSLKPTFTLGENKLDPGSGNPINDPFDPTAGMSTPDAPQIDTGDSGVIDEGDGFDGDGDDLHQNPTREDWTDGTPGIDYGTDLANATNKPGSTGTAGSQVWKAKVTLVTSPTYSIETLHDDGTVHATFTNVASWPLPTTAYAEDDEVVVFFPVDGTDPVIIGHANSIPLEVEKAYITGDFRFFGAG